MSFRCWIFLTPVCFVGKSCTWGDGQVGCLKLGGKMFRMLDELLQPSSKWWDFGVGKNEESRTTSHHAIQNQATHVLG